MESHMLRKEEARAEKLKDKKLAKDSLDHGYTGERVMVFCMDLQALLLSPKLNASALYYKSKLAVHNFTIYNLGLDAVTCYVWHEGSGGITSNEFSSCILDYLESHVQQFDTFIIYSDGCCYQNRNTTLSNSLQQFAIKTVIQKILERGHTQMEVDSVHSQIERKLKHTPIYCASQYVDLMKRARKIRYDVKYLEYSFFKDYSQVGNLKSIRPGRNVKGEPVVTDLRCLKYSPDQNGTFLFKLNSFVINRY